MNVRTRPLTHADWDVRPGLPLLHNGGDFQDGVVLEDTRHLMGLCTYQHVRWPITRGRDGWAISALNECQECQDDHPAVVRLEDLYIARGKTVEEMLPLVRAVQRHASERSAEWVVAVVNPLESCTSSPSVYDCQKALQQGRESSPVCWLFWELGFVDVILDESLLAFLWRNPAW